MTYQSAVELFQQGQFRRLIDNFSRSRYVREADANLRILVGYVLALTGETTQSIALLAIEDKILSADLRSQIETTRGIVFGRVGNTAAASQHLQAAVRLARESNLPARIAAAHIHHFRFAIDRQPLDASKAMLREVRAAVANAGVPWLTAYLHVCVSVLEGQRGHLDESVRHCDIAESILERHPNSWVLGCSLVNRCCIAILNCELKAAEEYIRTAIQLTGVNGNSRQRQAAEMTTAYIHFLSGEFEKAAGILTAALTDESADVSHRLDAADTLARVYLANGDLEKCSSLLENLFSFGTGPTDVSRYGKRCAATTRAKLLLRKGQLQKALHWLTELEPHARSAGDDAFSGVVHLLAAQALHRMGKGPECARQILKSEQTGIRTMLDLQAQLQYHLQEWFVI